ncbi:MAG: GNAT family N-acetyltransferase, partial [Oscillospiraceae bacterium]|nr:GNAT family N-acetyltransferase [Oscillospiraceae bacterium]
FGYSLGLNALEFNYLENEESFLDGFEVYDKRASGDFEQIYCIDISYKNLRHVKIDLEKDRDYIRECHCLVNYECDTPYARKIPYDEYRANWFANAGQQDGFLSQLIESMKDERTIAEIIKTESGETVGYFWVTFHGEDKSFIWTDVQDIYIEESYRKAGVAIYLMDYAEKSARQNGAKVIRSGTGCENTKSQGLHQKLGYYQYRFEYEKLLNDEQEKKL